MKRFCRGLQEHIIDIIHCHKKEMLMLTKNEKKAYHRQFFHLCKKESLDESADNENYGKV